MIRRGQIWWADLAEPRVSEPGYRHPVLVLPRDEVNASRINTVVVCLLTSNTALARAPGDTLLRRRRTGLRRDSVANTAQSPPVVPSDLMDVVGEGVRWFLDLG